MQTDRNNLRLFFVALMKGLAGRNPGGGVLTLLPPFMDRERFNPGIGMPLKRGGILGCERALLSLFLDVFALIFFLMASSCIVQMTDYCLTAQP